MSSRNSAALPLALALLLPAAPLGCAGSDDDCQGDRCSGGGKADDLDGDGGEDAAVGAWSASAEAPVHFLHGALMPTGRLLLFSGFAQVGFPLEAATFDPEEASPSFTTRALPGDLLCSHHSFLASGDLLVMGGGGQSTSDANTWSYVFDQDAETFGEVAMMATPRWYPTSIPLTDGRILVASGESLSAALEIYDPAANRWTEVTNSERNWPELYPGLHTLPDGTLFNSRTGWKLGFEVLDSGTMTIDGTTGSGWRDLGRMAFPDRREGTAAMWVDDSGEAPTSRIMVIGGGRPDFGEPSGEADPASAELIELGPGVATPAWRQAADMAFERTNVNAVVLPDGKLLVIGGREGEKWGDQREVMATELYDPASDTWTELDPANLVHQYHTVAMLLPSGRVFAGGGVDVRNGIDPETAYQHAFELFSPPYLFQGDRPRIAAAPDTVRYGEEIALEVAGAVAGAAMISPSSITHHTDAGGRHVKLRVVSTADGRAVVRAPSGPGVLPPGPQMLFVLDERGVPSPAAFVTLAP